MEDQPVEVVGQVGKGQLRLGTGKADGADEQPEPVLLMGKHMLDMSADRGLGCIGLPMGFFLWIRLVSILLSSHFSLLRDL